MGPARAALLMFRSEDQADELSLAVGVRSLKSGEVVYFQPDRSLSDTSESLDAGMAFGEGMGFLFDEDEIADGDTERAYGMWSDLMGAVSSMGPIGGGVDPISEISDDLSSEMLLTEEVAGAGDSQPILDLEPEITQPPAPPDTNLLTSMIESALATASDGLPPPNPLEDPEYAELGPEELESLDTPALTKFRTAEFGSSLEDEQDDTPVLADLDSPTPEADLDPSLPAADVEAAPAAEPTATLPPTTPPEPTQAEKPKERRSRGRAALGKLRLVKKRKLAASDERSHFLARILSSF